MKQFVCPTCKNTFTDFPSQKRVYCSKPCFTQYQKGKHASPNTEFKKNQQSFLKGRKLFHLRGKNANHWKGGKYVLQAGYVLMANHKHPFSTKGGWVRRSHLVMEKHLGRFILPGEIVHHKGIHFPINSIKNKQDDCIENLQVMTDSTHKTLHRHLYFAQQK